MKKKLKKKLKKKINFDFDFFFLILKVRRLGRKPIGFQTVRILKICRTFGPDVMSGRALMKDLDVQMLNFLLIY